MNATVINSIINDLEIRALGKWDGTTKVGFGQYDLLDYLLDRLAVSHTDYTHECIQRVAKAYDLTLEQVNNLVRSTNNNLDRVEAAKRWFKRLLPGLKDGRPAENDPRYIKVNKNNLSGHLGVVATFPCPEVFTKGNTGGTEGWAGAARCGPWKCSLHTGHEGDHVRWDGGYVNADQWTIKWPQNASGSSPGRKVVPQNPDDLNNRIQNAINALVLGRFQTSRSSVTTDKKGRKGVLHVLALTVNQDPMGFKNLPVELAKLFGFTDRDVREIERANSSTHSPKQRAARVARRLQIILRRHGGKPVDPQAVPMEAKADDLSPVIGKRGKPLQKVSLLWSLLDQIKNNTIQLNGWENFTPTDDYSGAIPLTAALRKVTGLAGVNAAQDAMGLSMEEYRSLVLASHLNYKNPDVATRRTKMIEALTKIIEARREAKTA